MNPNASADDTIGDAPIDSDAVRTIWAAVHPDPKARLLLFGDFARPNDDPSEGMTNVTSERNETAA